MDKNIPETQPYAADPVLRLYAMADALLHLARTLPEEDGGLSFILDGMARELKRTAAELDNKTP